ncbi:MULTISPECIES: hypothetical protein [unclassified Nocardioides]|uniref:hypothetical protein n=1 Tax=unclassified Nocardioides TaxID=2615069 RepID=UPI0036092D3F
MPHWLPTPPRWLWLALLALRTGALSLVVLLALSTLTGAGLDRGSGSDAATAHRPAAVQQMIDRHRCSTSGFEGEDPASAIVRSLDGKLRLVSWEQGWRVYTRHGAASLVAVCLDAPRT